jgi:hypothetical protein
VAKLAVVSFEIGLNFIIFIKTNFLLLVHY